MDCVSERIWKIFEKKTKPLILEENDNDYESYQSTVDARDRFYQEMADLEWEMSKAIHR